MLWYAANSQSIFNAWRHYFLANHPKPGEIPWSDPYKLSPSEGRTIQHSIQQFQLGEGSEGRRLLDRGRAYSRAAGDPHFAEALSLFVKEEQRHSAHLLQFMRGQEIPQISAHWVDSVFRRLRVLAGLELSLRVLVTAEVISVPFYRALSRATGSTLLAAISERILGDEAAHLGFQSAMLSSLEAARHPAMRRLIWRFHRLFLLGTSFVVWLEHGSVFRAAAYGFKSFTREALAEFAALESSQRRAFIELNEAPISHPVSPVLSRSSCPYLPRKSPRAFTAIHPDSRNSL
ncbi:MAG: ferritin-like domain-containing protein [Candidatus Acidiferrales bacterium]